MGAQVPWVSGCPAGEATLASPSQVCCWEQGCSLFSGGGQGSGHCCATSACKQLIENTLGHVPTSGSTSVPSPRQWRSGGSGWGLALPAPVPISQAHSTSLQQVQIISRDTLGYTIPAKPPTCPPPATPIAWLGPLGHPCGAFWGWKDGEKKEKKFFHPFATLELLPISTYLQSVCFSTLKGAGTNVTLQYISVNKATSVNGHMHKFSPRFPRFSGVTLEKE